MKYDGKMDENTYNVIIVGAGISGLYAAFQLKSRFPLLNILIMEQTDETGGRIKTGTWKNFILEYGPMRFEPDLQPKFWKLITDLNIHTIDFSPYTSPYDNPDYNKLELNEITAIIQSNYAPAFALIKFALKIILKGIWDVDVKYITDREKKKLFLKEEGKFNGSFLYEQGIWDVFSCVLSKEAIDYLQVKGTFYHMLSVNPNAADMICFLLDIIDTANDTLITVHNGSNEIISKLESRVKSLGTSFLFNTKVVEFQDKGSSVIVKSNYEEYFYCNRLIFTLPYKAYSDIIGFSPHITNIMTESVILLELFKLFVIFTDPPYNSNSIPKVNSGANKIPCRELHYYYDDTTNLGMIQIYGDYPSINFWNTFSKNQASLCSENINKENMSQHVLLRGHIQRSLKSLFPNTNSEIEYYSMINWSNKPLNTGVHLWRPGYKSNDIMHELHKIGNVHVCGETFSTYQGFIEGALISVDKVLTTFE